MAGIDRLKELIQVETDDCVEWDGKLDRGYGSVYIPERKRSFHSNRATLLLTIGDPPDDQPYDAAHGPCHNRACVNPRHLSWKTRKENQADRRRDGTFGTLRRGLTPSEVTEIRRRCSEGETQMQVASDFGISGPMVCYIVNRICHKDVA